MIAVTAPPNRPAPTLVGSASALLAGHQFRIHAGVPGCSCGEEFTPTNRSLAELHILHLAPLVVRRVLMASAAALREELSAPDAETAVSVLSRILRQGSNPTDGRHNDGNP